MKPTLNQLFRICARLGGCEPGLRWFRNQLEEKPEITFADLWLRLLAMRRSPEERAYEAEAKKENPQWKSDPDTHTGWAWLAWLAKNVARVPCSTGTFSGRRKIADGPNVDAIDPQSVYEALCLRFENDKEWQSWVRE